MDLEDITVLHGDTAVSPYGMGTFASRSAVAGGGATRIAARAMREKVLGIAAHLLEAPVEDLEIQHGRISVRGSADRSLTLRDVGKVAYFTIFKMPESIEPGLEITRHYDPPLGTFSNGATAVVVDVDIETGQVTVLRHVIVEDCGVAINPRIVAAQVHGGAAQGVAMALYEDMQYDENGQLLTASFMDYLLPTAAEAPAFELDSLHSPSPITEGGFKGMGEGGAIAPPSAIANAVRDALAPLPVRLNDLPRTPARNLAALAAARQEAEAQPAG